MTCSGVFDLNSAPLQEHDFLAAPSDLKLQQVPDAALPPMRAAGGGAHVLLSCRKNKYKLLLIQHNLPKTTKIQVPSGPKKYKIVVGPIKIVCLPCFPSSLLLSSSFDALSSSFDVLSSSFAPFIIILGLRAGWCTFRFITSLIFM